MRLLKATMMNAEPLYERQANQRKLEIIAQYDAGLYVSKIAEIHQLARSTVYRILEDLSRIRMSDVPTERVAPVMIMPQGDSSRDADATDSIKRGSRSLLRALLLMHHRTDTLPPGYDARSFYALAEDIGLTFRRSVAPLAIRRAA